MDTKHEQNIIDAILLDSELCDKLIASYIRYLAERLTSRAHMIEIFNGIQVHFKAYSQDFARVDSNAAILFIIEVSEIIWRANDITHNAQAIDNIRRS